ncbi:hypothetical protein PM082_011467 [Marasmius tenuissimus]|nr:hypothetical protein PM082_011467 [Marasmius tenuissimus]
MPTTDNSTRDEELQKDQQLLKLIRSRGVVPLIGGERPANVPNLADVQGDPLFQFPKSSERFVFFRIEDPSAFKVALRDFKPTSAKDVQTNIFSICKARQEVKLGNKQAVERIKLKQYLIAFSRKGLDVLGLEGKKTGDVRFDTHSMRDDKDYLGDQRDWLPLFEQGFKPEQGIDETQALHGVIAIATDNDEDRDEATDDLKAIFGKSWDPRGEVDGKVRPDENRHNEHFGFKDGISQPSVRGVNHPLPGQIQVDPGVIIMGYDSDPVPNREAWTKDGTMMAFKKLHQSVLSWDDYVIKNGERWREFFPGGQEAADRLDPPLTNEEGAQLFGARFVGRWQSGAPIALAPIRDDPDLGNDPKRNNDFDYSVRDVPGVSPHEPSDYYCPFTAHSRKTVPRNLDPYVSRQYLESGAIVRAAIAYGPEVTEDERKKWQSAPAKDKPPEVERGLLFNCYSSHLDSGFVRQSTGYGNNDYFPITGLIPVKHGQDPIIGGPPPEGSSKEEKKASLDAAPTNQFQDGDEVDIDLKIPGDTLSCYTVSGQISVRPLTQAAPPGADNPFFVTSQGGEYFFVPSIPTLKSWAN